MGILAGGQRGAAAGRPDRRRRVRELAEPIGDAGGGVGAGGGADPSPALRDAAAGLVAVIVIGVRAARDGERVVFE
jgi:hypothetical protein